jgi:hypothetical protein
MSRDGHDKRSKTDGLLYEYSNSFAFGTRALPYRDRDFVNVSDRDLVQYDRFRPFTVPDRFQSFYERFRSFYERFRSFVTYFRRSTGIRIMNINGKKCP